MDNSQRLTLALYFNATRWFVTIKIHVPAYQRKPKAEFHATEVRPASNSAIEWELTFAKQFLKSYRRVLNDWTRNNVKSLIEQRQRWLKSPPPAVTDLMTIIAANTASPAHARK